MKMNATATNDKFAAAGTKGASSLFAKFAVSQIGNVLRSIATFPRRRAVRDELYNLSDRELADIGLSRADISHVFDAEFTARRDAHRDNLRAARRATI